MGKSAFKWLNKSLLLGILISGMISFVFSGVSMAASSSTSQGYLIDKPLPEGSLVSRDIKNADKIIASKLNNRDQLIGVVIPESNSLVAFSQGDQRQQVANNGLALIRVANINGEIKKGDAISPSPISGMGMKANTSGKVIGFARDDFSSGASDKTKLEVTDRQGKKEKVEVGRLVVQVQVQDWTPDGVETSPTLSAIKSFVGNAVGKPVTNFQALLSVGIILIAIVVAAIILHSAVSASIHSIGRNPLSKSIVRRSMIGMLVLAVAIVVGACSAVYLILRGL